MTIAEFDHFDVKTKKELLYSCCPSDAWVKSMLSVFPVEDLIDLLECAEEKWYECNGAEWLEVFHHYPKVNALNATTQPFVSAEPGVLQFSKEQSEELENGVLQYEDIFGYNFIVFTKGRTVNEIITLLKKRLENNPKEELLMAAAEQNRINQSKLQMLFM
jgi:2-oxo-4-hydroxy-4-carboxy-5-ureidoimidazoline decarboxylase